MAVLDPFAFAQHSALELWLYRPSYKSYLTFCSFVRLDTTRVTSGGRWRNYRARPAHGPGGRQWNYCAGGSTYPWRSGWQSAAPLPTPPPPSWPPDRGNDSAQRCRPLDGETPPRRPPPNTLPPGRPVEFSSRLSGTAAPRSSSHAHSAAACRFFECRLPISREPATCQPPLGSVLSIWERRISPGGKHLAHNRT